MTILSNEKNWLITNVLLINLLFKHAAIGYMCQRPAWCGIAYALLGGQPMMINGEPSEAHLSARLLSEASKEATRWEGRFRCSRS